MPNSDYYYYFFFANIFFNVCFTSTFTATHIWYSHLNLLTLCLHFGEQPGKGNKLAPDSRSKQNFAMDASCIQARSSWIVLMDAKQNQKLKP